ncbi:MAG: glycosyltransferase family 2 protein [Candidatus Omnitrophota bacterium]
MKNKWSIVIPVYNQYELFRQCFESILYQLEVTEIIVVDDYSYPNGKLRSYLDYIENKYGNVRVIKSDEYRVCYHASDADKKVDEQINREQNMNMGVTTRGHRYALQTGIDAVKTEFTLNIDADCVALELCKNNNLLQQLTDLFDRNHDCMAIGQVAGFMSHDIKPCNQGFIFDYNGKPNTEGGCPGSPVVACRMSGFKEHNLTPIATCPSRAGWAYAYYTHSVFQKNFSIMNFPILSQKYFYHIGGGILNFARGGRRQESMLGMVKDTRQYGGRLRTEYMTEWYQGRWVLDIKSHDYIRYLQDKYNSPFEEIQPLLDENLLYTVKEECKPKFIEYIKY